MTGMEAMLEGQVAKNRPTKKCLVVYSSYTGNTQKVAARFKTTFEKHGWVCDIVKIRKKAEDILDPPFQIEDYDFVCVGSGLRSHLPYNEILNVLRRLNIGADPRYSLRMRDETIPYIEEPLPEGPAPWERPGAQRLHGKMVLGADSPKAVVFITYSGFEFGPKEAQPGLQLLELEIEHQGFQCIGRFCCPGKYRPDDPTPHGYHGDIRDRPNETDLLKAELFIEEMLEVIAERPA